MRCIFIFTALWLSVRVVTAHPSPGIVKDYKGNIYYTVLSEVWKISPTGHKTKTISGVHTHELYIDHQDVLFGEHVWYNGEKMNTRSCSAWRL